MAALSMSALVNCAEFDLSKTHFLIAGIAGVNPQKATIGSIALSKFAFQTDLQMQYDAREIPQQWPSGFVPMGAKTLDGYPSTIYGSEVFELNDTLRRRMFEVAQRAKLVDSERAVAHRAMYSSNAARQGPGVILGDTAASNAFFHGKLMGEAADRIARLYTDGQADYCMTALEDTVTLAALLRGALDERLDFSRVILMRSGSNFDRPYSDDHLPTVPFIMDHGGFEPAIRNLFSVGQVIVDEILEQWASTFEDGLQPENYVGDLLGSLGGSPSYGPHRSAEEQV